MSRKFGLFVFLAVLLAAMFGPAQPSAAQDDPEYIGVITFGAPASPFGGGSFVYKGDVTSVAAWVYPQSGQRGVDIEYVYALGEGMLRLQWYPAGPAAFFSGSWSEEAFGSAQAWAKVDPATTGHWYGQWRTMSGTWESLDIRWDNPALVEALASAVGIHLQPQIRVWG